MAVVLATAAGPALADGYASGSGRPTAPLARLTISYMADAGFAAAVKLECDPVGGGHPQGPRACADLHAADADPARIPPGPGMCIAVYAPVLAEVNGTWHGKFVAWRHRFGNSCEMRRATGALFDF